MLVDIFIGVCGYEGSFEGIDWVDGASLLVIGEQVIFRVGRVLLYRLA